MTASGRAIREVLGAAVRRLRLEGAAGVAVAVAALVPGLLLAAWLVGGWGMKGAGPLTLWLVAAGGGIVLLVLLGRRWVRAVDASAVAAAAERARSLPDGSLRGVVELGDGLPDGVSAALFRRTESDLAGQVSGMTARDMAGELGRLARRRRWRVAGVAGGLVLLTALAGFGAPDRARAAWTPLLRPLDHLAGPIFPGLVVMPGDTVVDRGASVGVRVRAELRDRVTVHWRSVGDVPRSRDVRVEAGDGRARIGPVASVVSYWVEAPDGAVSDTFRASPRDPLMVTRLAVDVTYPAHVGRDADHYQGDTPLLRVPEGTRIAVRGMANRPLDRAGVVGDDGRERAARVDGSSFGMDWTLTPAATGRWEWSLVDATGVPAPAMAPLEIVVVEDAPPGVRVTVPGMDTLMPGSLRQPIVAEAADDHGIVAGALVFRRVDGRGQRGDAVSVPLALAGSSGRGSLRGVLDASDQPLIPGDAIEYHVEVVDNAPARQVGRSATYVLRLPSMAELRERARRESEEALASTRRLADRARELESRTRDLSRSAASRGQGGRSGGEPGTEAPPERLGFESASEARDVVAEHENVLSEVSELRSRLAALERAVQEAGLRDPELQRRLNELRELFSRLATPELREQMRALAEAADQLDPEAVQRALEQLAARQEEFRAQIEETLEMMRRAAAEQELNTLAREAEEVAARQEALAEALAGSEEEPEQPEPAPPGAQREEPTVEGGEMGLNPSPAEQESRSQAEAEQAEAEAERSEAERSEPESSSEGEPSSEAGEAERRAEEQEDLEERAQQLTQSMQSLQMQLLQMGEEESAAQTGSAQEQGEASQRSMQEAAEQARQQQGSQASQSGQRAAQQMAAAAETLDQARQEMAEAQRRQAQEAVQQATQEALGLAQRQESLRQQMERAQRQGGAQGQSMQEMRSEQAALQQGLDQLGRNLSETGERSAMIDRQVRESLERAGVTMDETLSGLEEGTLPVQQAGRTVEALNQLALSLLENDAAMQRAEAPGGLQEALGQLADLAQEQGSLNGRLSALAPMRLAEQALTRQLQDAARQQQGVAGRIGQLSRMLGGREDVLGRLDQMSAEAAAIARELEGGRLDPGIMARQERLFHRLLDAGRSLEREEYSDERVGARPDVVESAPPEALDPSLLDTGLRYPLPTPEQLERLPPAYRRLILEYFERLNRRGGR